MDMILVKCLILVFLCTISVKSLIELKNQTYINISNFFIDMCMLCKTEANANSFSVIFYDESNKNIPNSFLYDVNQLLGPLTITNNIKNVLFYHKPIILPQSECVVLIIKNLNNLYKLVLNSYVLWNFTNYYIVIVLEKVPANGDLITIFSNLWNNYQLINILLVSILEMEKIFTYSPFNNVVLNGKIDIFYTDRYKELTDTIKYRMRNMHKHKLNISMFSKRITSVMDKTGEFHGSDAKILAVLANKMNFTPVLKVPNDGERYGYRSENGTFTGALGDIIYHRSVFVSNAMFLKDYETTDIDFTYPFKFDQLCIAVPKSELIPQWMSVFLCFNMGVWFGILGAFIFTLAIWCIIQYLINKESDFVSLGMEVFVVFLGSSTQRKIKFVTERVFLITTITFGFIMASCFQGSLVKLLSTKGYKEEITTMDDFDLSGLYIYTFSKNLQDTFSEDDKNPVIKNIFSKFKVPKNKDEEILKLVSHERNVAALGRKKDLEVKIAINYTVNGIPLVHIVEECPRNYYLGFILYKNSPFLKSINHIILNFVEGGIFESWFLRDFQLEIKIKLQKPWSTRTVFELEHLFVAFRLLFTGLFISFAIFVCEIIVISYTKIKH